jgi:hypothetical protein
LLTASAIARCPEDRRRDLPRLLVEMSDEARISHEIHGRQQLPRQADTARGRIYIGANHHRGKVLARERARICLRGCLNERRSEAETKTDEGQ